MKCSIYYGNGTIVKDEDCLPENVPKRDVQVVLVESERVGRRVERMSDFYIWTPERGGWRGVDNFGLFDYLIDPGEKIVLFGRTLSTDDFSDIMVKATQDPYLPAKSGKEVGERT